MGSDSKLISYMHIILSSELVIFIVSGFAVELERSGQDGQGNESSQIEIYLPGEL